MKKIILAVLLIPFAISSAQDDNVRFRTEEISFQAGRFFVTGSLMLPDSGSNFPVAVMCWGSGPTDRKSFIKNSKILRTFIKSGFAFFAEDKPGSGESTGEFSNDSIFYERAEILIKEIEILKLHPEIDPKRTGLYGSSQAGYVMPIVLNKVKDISFMVAWSCPAANSLEQSAYLVKKQVLCESGDGEEAGRVEKYFLQRRNAKTYEEYFEAAKYLDGNSVIKELGWGGIADKDEFVPADKNNISYFNPVYLLENVKIPVLAIYGEKDTQVDPVQAAEGYRKALEKAGNNNFRIITIEGVDHNMRLTKTGSLKEQKENYGKEGGAVLSPVFLSVISRWLETLKMR